MMKKMLVAALLSLAATVAYSAEPLGQPVKNVVKNVSVTNFEIPPQKIEGAEKSVELGDVVLLNLSKIDKAPASFVSYAVEWKVFDRGLEKKFFKTSDGNGIFFGSGIDKRKLIVFASVSYLYVVKDGDKFVEAGVKSVFLTIVVDIGDSIDPPIPPGPNPNPVPVPEPVFPDGQFKLAAKAYKFGEKVEPLYKRGGEFLSKSFAAQAAKIAAGGELATANDIRKLLEDTTLANRKALTDNFIDAKKWDAYFTALQDEIYDLYSSGKLKTKNDFSTAWREISSGLEKVK